MNDSSHTQAGILLIKAAEDEAILDANGIPESILGFHAQQAIEKLIKALIAGRWVGPVEAIGQDYRALEMKGVVEVRPNPRRGFDMKLLKKDVGQIALEVIKAGDASEVILNLPGATVTGYVGPEANREGNRRKQQVAGKRQTRDIVMALRTGSGLK